MTIIFLGCMVRTKIVVGSPGIVAGTSYDVINMAPANVMLDDESIDEDSLTYDM